MYTLLPSTIPIATPRIVFHPNRVKLKHQANLHPAKTRLDYFFPDTDGSGSIPSASNLRRASSRAHVCILRPQHISPHPIPDSPKLHFSVPLHGHACPTEPTPRTDGHDSRSVRFISIRHNPQHQTPEEPIDPYILPPFLLVLLSWRDAPQPARWRVVVVFVRAGRKPWS